MAKNRQNDAKIDAKVIAVVALRRLGFKTRSLSDWVTSDTMYAKGIAVRSARNLPLMYPE